MFNWFKKKEIKEEKGCNHIWKETTPSIYKFKNAFLMWNFDRTINSNITKIIVPRGKCIFCDKIEIEGMAWWKFYCGNNFVDRHTGEDLYVDSKEVNLDMELIEKYRVK